MVVLVGYATAHGSTHEVAERLAADLGRAGLKADVRPLEAVEDADTYGAFFLGSAVHNQNGSTRPAGSYATAQADPKAGQRAPRASRLDPAPVEWPLRIERREAG
jgi:hypothetical protein